MGQLESECRGSNNSKGKHRSGKRVIPAAGRQLMEEVNLGKQRELPEILVNYYRAMLCQQRWSFNTYC